jgi:hypothetical protein
MRWLLALLSLLSAPALATEVDVELALMVDVSRSMGPDELELQRHGYAAAIASDEVVGAILNGFTGRIAVTYVEWAGNLSQRVVVPWTLIDSREAAEDIARQLTANFSFGMRRTSISGAIDYAAFDIETNDFEGLRKVIDISGDGPNNQGRPVTAARDAALAEDLVINGLPLMTFDAQDSIWGIEDLDLYYEACVIGGPGAFVIPVRDWKEFPLAVRRKIVLELAGPPEALIPARTGATDEGYDCMIGEKLRRERERTFGEP